MKFALVVAAVAVAGLGCAAGDAEKDATETAAAAKEVAGKVAEAAEGLMNADSADMKQKAPKEFRVKFETSKGDFIMELDRGMAPRGVDRIYNLVNAGFYDGVRFFRVLDNFMAQFGISGDPKVSAAWNQARILDDPVRQSNTRGMVSFAMAGPNTRTTQLFINYKDNSSLDGQGFSPIGRVVEGMEVVDSFYKGYGEGAPRGQGPNQARVQAEGNTYLEAEFPQLDYVKKATIIE
jgi:peptidyl-prolyl cis-trans isomerase A (cyclophilin A)